MLAAVKTASAPPCGGGLRPVLTAAVRDAEPMCRPGRRNGASAERRNGRAFGYAANRRVLCGWLTKVRIELSIGAQKGPSIGVQLVSWTRRACAFGPSLKHQDAAAIIDGPGPGTRHR